MIRKNLWIAELVLNRRLYGTSVASKVPAVLNINKITFSTDDWTNIKSRFEPFIGRCIYRRKDHPLTIARQRIVEFLHEWIGRNDYDNPTFEVIEKKSSVQKIDSNLSGLFVPSHSVNRNKSEIFYVNREFMLQTHNIGHQVKALNSGLRNFIVIGDVYRRVKVDATHFPVFHRIDVVRTISRDKLFANNSNVEIFESNYKSNQLAEVPLESAAANQSSHTLEAVKQINHELKTVPVELVKHLFGADVKYRWVEAQFSFTQPSWKLEICHNDIWLEVIRSGIILNEIFEACEVQKSIGWTVGIGLDRLAMLLYNIPELRLFWSTAIMQQFDEKKTIAKMQNLPKATFHIWHKDISFMLPDGLTVESFPLNEFYAFVRDNGGDIVENVLLNSSFYHPKEKKTILNFRITYHKHHNRTQAEVNLIHMEIRDKAARKFSLETRL